MPGVKGKSGRRPQPTALKVISGGKMDAKTKEGIRKEPMPDKPAKVPTPPTHLGEVAKAFWKKNAQSLYDLGLLTVADLDAFEAMCQAYGLMRDAQAGMKLGPFVQDPDFIDETGKVKVKKKIKNPWHAIYNNAVKQFKGYQMEFGMTPSSRVKVQDVPVPPHAPAQDKNSRWGAHQLPQL